MDLTFSSDSPFIGQVPLSVRFKRSVMKGTFFGVSGFAQLQAMLTEQAEHSG